MQGGLQGRRRAVEAGSEEDVERVSSGSSGAGRLEVGGGGGDAAGAPEDETERVRDGREGFHSHGRGHKHHCCDNRGLLDDRGG